LRGIFLIICQATLQVVDGHEQALTTVAEVLEIPDAEHGETVEVGVNGTQVTVVETVVKTVVETSIVEIAEVMPEAVLQGEEVQEGFRDPVIEEQAAIPEQIQREDLGVQTEEDSEGTDGEEAIDETGDSGEDSEEGNAEEESDDDEDIEEEDENADELVADEAVDEDEVEVEAQEEGEEEEEDKNDEDETDEESPPTFGEKLWDFFTT
jgi:hypothetical protein